MDDVRGLTDSRADDLLDRSTQFQQFGKVNNLDGRAPHGRADYYVDDEPHAPQLSKRDSKVDQGYLDEADYGDDDLHADDSCAYGECDVKDSCAHGQCGVKDSCAYGQCGPVKESCAHGQCGVKEDLDHDGIVHGGDRRIRGSYGYGSYGRRSYGGYAY